MPERLEKASLFDRSLYRLGFRRGFIVEGDSMMPTVRSGDVVLIRPTADYSVGDIVLSNHPYKTSVKLLKRISQIDADGAVQLVGDNPAESTDSRAFGAVSLELVMGKVVGRLK